MDGSLWDKVRIAINRAWLELVIDRFHLFGARIDGVEVTQTIQYYRADRHLTDPADRGPDNSVRLIANKPAWVRVYVRSGLLPVISGVTGRLEVERRRFGFLWGPVITVNPRPPGSVTARQAPDYATERGAITDTLNFVIPAADFWGTLRLRVHLRDSAGDEIDTEVVTVDATLRQTLRIRGILVSYNGPSTAVTPPGSPPPPTVTLAAPTLANLQATAALALRAMPVQSTGSFASAGTVAWTLPLDDPRSCPGCCSPNWNALLTALTNQRTADGNRTDVVYYGLLPAAIPLGVPGCGQGGLGSAASGNQPTLMHEIGHGYGFQHTPCGNAGSTDPNYPIYQPYASASIGEFGLDIADGSIMAPATSFDYMSYCGPRWMSLYQHNRLILHPRIGQEWIRDDLVFERYVKWRDYWTPRDLPDPPPDPYRWIEMRFDPVIAISGIVHAPDEVEVTSVARVPAAGSPPGERTNLSARLVDGDGKTLAEGAVHRLTTWAGGCGCSDEHGEDDDREFPFEAYVPDVEHGAALAIHDAEREVWVRHAPDQAPVVAKVDARITDDGRLALRWDASARPPEGDEGGDWRPQAWAQWSGDDGASWCGLATGLIGGEATVELTGVPPGDVLVRLLVHDGFSTAVSEPARVAVPERPPEVAILHPEEAAIIAAGGTLRAWASITDPAGASLERFSCRWFLDGREVATDPDSWLEAPDPGDHRLTLVVRTDGGEVERTVTFSCRPAPGHEPAVGR